MKLLDELNRLTNHHKKNCKLYKHYINTIFPNIKKIKKLEDIQWLPVRAFKNHELKSITDNKVFKIMQSSGTSGTKSKIFLDKENARSQQLKLIEIFTKKFGKDRFPMLVIDSEKIIKDRLNFSARTAAINGFSIFSKFKTFALDDEMKINEKNLLDFFEKVSGKTFFIFGFTSIIWQFFIKNYKEKKLNFDFSKSFLLHGGGWKKLENANISQNEFKNKIQEIVGCSKIYNYYGMIEQTGSIFLECEYGNLHAPNGSDFIIRSFKNLKPLKANQEGLIQLFSNIQTSYPGHSILSEDIGKFLPSNYCNCGSKRKVLKIIGRAKKAEVRGCSDAIN